MSVKLTEPNSVDEFSEVRSVIVSVSGTEPSEEIMYESGSRVTGACDGVLLADVVDVPGTRRV
jgi:hypothetical protein